MKRITDDTIVKVKVPKHLYESIMKRMALKEAKEMKGKEKESHKKKHEKLKEEQQIEESALMDVVNFVKDNWEMISVAGGLPALAAWLSNAIKKQGGQPGGSTGAYIPQNSNR